MGLTNVAVTLTILFRSIYDLSIAKEVYKEGVRISYEVT